MTTHRGHRAAVLTRGGWARDEAAGERAKCHAVSRERTVTAPVFSLEGEEQLCIGLVKRCTNGGMQNSMSIYWLACMNRAMIIRHNTSCKSFTFKLVR